MSVERISKAGPFFGSKVVPEAANARPTQPGRFFSTCVRVDVPFSRVIRFPLQFVMTVAVDAEEIDSTETASVWTDETVEDGIFSVASAVLVPTQPGRFFSTWRIWSWPTSVRTICVPLQFVTAETSPEDAKLVSSVNVIPRKRRAVKRILRNII